MNRTPHPGQFLPILGGAIAFSTWVSLVTPTVANPPGTVLTTPAADTTGKGLVTGESSTAVSGTTLDPRDGLSLQLRLFGGSWM